jgi:hypothetical protein
MRTLDLGKYQRARIWMGDLPDAIYTPQKNLKHRIPTKQPSYATTKTAAVEMVIPTGGRSFYGLIGGRLEPSSESFVDLTVGISQSNGRPSYDPLSANDLVRVGLPEEYAEAVLSGVDLANNQLGSLAAGRMLIDCAAHGSVGSCSDMFKRLTLGLTKMLNAHEEELSNNEIIHFLTGM